MSRAGNADIKSVDILGATKLLETIVPQDVKLNPGLFLKRKLYRGTRLEGELDGSDSGFILRKNIYYLARSTKNATMLAIQMTQRGIFTLDEKDEILDIEGDLPKAITLYRVLIQQDSSNFQEVVDIMRAHDNAHIADILDQNGISAERPDSSPRNLGQSQKPPEKRPAPASRPASPWSCAFCTYINKLNAVVCEMCSNGRGQAASVPEERDEGIVTCNFCTFRTPRTDNFCGGCGSPLKVLVGFQNSQFELR